MGDRLIVAITRDCSVNKGPGRPIFTAFQRAQMLLALRCVDDVIVVDSTDEALGRVRPSIFVKGQDYVNKIEPRHLKICEQDGIEIRFTSGPKFSSTDLVERL